MVCSHTSFADGRESGETDLQSFARFESDVYSQPEPIQSTASEWGAEFTRGERQWIRSIFEVGARYAGVELAYQYRALVDLRLNAEAAAYYGQLERGQPLVAEEGVPVHIDINGFSAQGIRLGYSHRTQAWQFGGGAVLMQAENLMSGQLDGSFQTLSQRDYDLQAEVDYHYFRDPLFHRPNVNEATGTGWAMQLWGEWQPTERWRLKAAAEDLFGRIRWKDAPYTRAELHTDRKRYDAEGYAIFDPLFRGVEGYENFTQRLDPRYQADVAYERGAWQIQLQGVHQFDFTYAGVGAGVAVGKDSDVSVMLYPKLNAVGLEWNSGEFNLGLALDDVSQSDVQYVALNMSYGFGR